MYLILSDKVKILDLLIDGIFLAQVGQTLWEK
jgi:hypothetical protein